MVCLSEGQGWSLPHSQSLDPPGQKHSYILGTKGRGLG